MQSRTRQALAMAHQARQAASLECLPVTTLRCTREGQLPLFGEEPQIVAALTTLRCEPCPRQSARHGQAASGQTMSSGGILLLTVPTPPTHPLAPAAARHQDRPTRRPPLTRLLRFPHPHRITLHCHRSHPHPRIHTPPTLHRHLRPTPLPRHSSSPHTRVATTSPLRHPPTPPPPTHRPPTHRPRTLPQPTRRPSIMPNPFTRCLYPATAAVHTPMSLTNSPSLVPRTTRSKPCSSRSSRIVIWTSQRQCPLQCRRATRISLFAQLPPLRQSHGPRGPLTSIPSGKWSKPTRVRDGKASDEQSSKRKRLSGWAGAGARPQRYHATAPSGLSARCWITSCSSSTS